MDPISGLPPTGPLAPVSARARARGRGFSVADGAAAPVSAGLDEADCVAEASLAGLLALQEDAGGGATRDRAARQRGRDLLAELAALQRDLLAGPPGAARLARLVDLADAAPDAADPRLRDILTAIALRARVEAARYGVG
jgi:hypothetical protein